MGIALGRFYGYREEEPAVTGKQKFMFPFGIVNPPQTNPIEIEMLTIPTYQYVVFSGDAPAAYPAELTAIGFETRMLVISVDGRVVIQFSFDGTALQEEQEFRGPFRVVQAIRAFRARSAIEGLPAWYQLVAMV